MAYLDVSFGSELDGVGKLLLEVSCFVFDYFVVWYGSYKGFLSEFRFPCVGSFNFSPCHCSDEFCHGLRER